MIDIILTKIFILQIKKRHTSEYQSKSLSQIHNVILKYDKVIEDGHLEIDLQNLNREYQANHMTSRATSHKEACSIQSFQDDYEAV